MTKLGGLSSQHGWLREPLDQGFSNFFSEGPDATPVQPERARTVFGGGGGGVGICAQSANSLAAGVQGPLKGPGSSGVIDAL